MWKKLSSKVLVDRPRLAIVEDDILLHNGQPSTYLRFEHPGNGASIIAQRDDSKILLQKEYNYPLNQSLYQFPGGVVPFNENIDQGAARELTEETGYHAEKLQQVGWYYPQSRRSEEKMYVYTAQNLSEKYLPPDAEELIEIDWFTSQEIDSMIKNGEIVDGSTLSCWSIYKEHSK